MNYERTIPGTPGYTEEEQKKRDDLFRAALDAEEVFDLDELERYAEEVRDGVD